MLFSSPIFLFLFLPLVLTIYFIVPQKIRNLFLLLVSLVFYYWGEKQFVVVMLLSIVVNYCLAIIIGKCDDTKSSLKRKLLFGLSIIFNLGLLVFFKYGGFILHNLHLLLNMPIRGEYFFSQVHLPLGISFFTFHSLSYVFDVFRGTVSPQKKAEDGALYIAFFPQLIAGPIIRYHDIYKQLAKREITRKKITYGIERFVLGLAKKVLIANVLGSVADQVFAIPPGQLSLSVSWLGIICYTLQIYFDFSGYSDMAISLARMFGFDFLENFNYPYISRSITEFWRRWHISLSNWFRDYLYIPLGGNRSGKFRTYVNLVIVFFLCGLWHGASWTFVVWGLWHGSFLVLERIVALPKVSVWKFYKHLYSLLVIMIGWVFFRSPTIVYAFSYLHTMFGGFRTDSLQYTLSGLVNSQVLLVLAIAIVFSAPVYSLIRSKLENLSKSIKISSPARQLAKQVVPYAYIGFLVLIFIGSAMSLAVNTYNPFIYFRF